MTAPTELDAREAFAERLVDDTTHALETLSVYLGLELGLYQALNGLGAATETDVAAHAGVAPRYAREWLEQQAAAGYLTCNDPERPAEQRRYQLPSDHAEVLLDADSPYHTAAAREGPRRLWLPRQTTQRSRSLLELVFDTLVRWGPGTT